MAHIKQSKKSLELDITPVSRWYEPGSEQPCVEYEIGLYFNDVALFADDFGEKFIALKDEQAAYLSTFILNVLAQGQGDNWIMLEPKVSIFMAPANPMSCACRGELPGQTPFFMEIKLDQNILEEQPFTEYSDTGLVLKILASREQWGEFARQLETEETDFEE